MLTIRLNPDMEEKLKTLAAHNNMTKTDIVKEALEDYYAKLEMKDNPYEHGKDLFGKYGSGKTDLSVTYKKTMKEKLYEKNPH